MTEHSFIVRAYHPVSMKERTCRITLPGTDRCNAYHELVRQIREDRLLGDGWVLAEPNAITSEAQADPAHRPGLPGSDFFGDALVRFPRRG